MRRNLSQPAAPCGRGPSRGVGLRARGPRASTLSGTPTPTAIRNPGPSQSLAAAALQPRPLAAVPDPTLRPFARPPAAFNPSHSPLYPPGRPLAAAPTSEGCSQPLAPTPSRTPPHPAPPAPSARGPRGLQPRPLAALPDSPTPRGRSNFGKLSQPLAPTPLRTPPARPAPCPLAAAHRAAFSPGNSAVPPFAPLAAAPTSERAVPNHRHPRARPGARRTLPPRPQPAALFQHLELELHHLAAHHVTEIMLPKPPVSRKPVHQELESQPPPECQ